MATTDVTCKFTIKAQNGPGALDMIRNKMQLMAPGRAWTVKPLGVRPPGWADDDGEHTGPPWLFDVEVTITVPIPGT